VKSTAQGGLSRRKQRASASEGRTMVHSPAHLAVRSRQHAAQRQPAHLSRTSTASMRAYIVRHLGVDEARSHAHPATYWALRRHAARHDAPPRHRPATTSCSKRTSFPTCPHGRLRKRGLKPCCAGCRGARSFSPMPRAIHRSRPALTGIPPASTPSIRRALAFSAQAGDQRLSRLLRARKGSTRAAASWSRTACPTSRPPNARHEDRVGERRLRQPPCVDVKIRQFSTYPSDSGDYNRLKPPARTQSVPENQNQIRESDGQTGRTKLQILQTLAGDAGRPEGRKDHHRRAGRPAGLLRSCALSPLRQQGADVRRADRVHRSSLFGVINQIDSEEQQGLQQVEQILACCSLCPDATAA
jgi:hypothetical protein